MFTFLEKAMTELSTPLYILTILAILVACGIALFVAYKLVILIINTIQTITNNKKLKLSKDGIELENDKGGQKDNPTLENDLPKVVNDMGFVFSEESLVTLIYELQNLCNEYYDKKRDIKLQAMTDQLKKFNSERLTFIILIQEKYLASLPKSANTDSYTMLFHYWFKTCFADTEDEIRDILQRNHLKDKTSDEYTDIINQLFDTTYGQVLTGVESAPGFIIDPKTLKTIIAEHRNEYRDYLDHSLQNAKKISEKAADDRKNIDNEFRTKRSEVIKRTFPAVDSEKIIKSVEKEY